MIAFCPVRVPRPLRVVACLQDIEAHFEAVKQNSGLRSALKRVDANNDDAVTKDEIDAALRTIVGSAQTEAAAAALIKYLDSDKDGVVSVETLTRFLDEYAERVAKAEAADRDAGASGSGGAPTSTKDADGPTPVAATGDEAPASPASPAASATSPQ